MTNELRKCKYTELLDGTSKCSVLNCVGQYLIDKEINSIFTYNLMFHNSGALDAVLFKGTIQLYT